MEEPRVFQRTGLLPRGRLALHPARDCSWARLEDSSGPFLKGLGGAFLLPQPHTQGYRYFISEPNENGIQLHIGSC